MFDSCAPAFVVDELNKNYVNREVQLSPRQFASPLIAIFKLVGYAEVRDYNQRNVSR